jgi:hypothetical protein
MGRISMTSAPDKENPVPNRIEPFRGELGTRDIRHGEGSSVLNREVSPTGAAGRIQTSL